MRHLLVILIASSLIFSVGCEGEMYLSDGTTPLDGSPFPSQKPTKPGEDPDPTDPLDPEVPVVEVFVPGNPVMRRLTSIEYVNTVEDAFGIGFVDLVLPHDPTTHGVTSIAMASVTVSNLGVEQYETAGFEIARVISAMPSVRERLVPCESSKVDDYPACFEQFIRNYGRRLWRRDLSDVEVKGYRDVAVEAAKTLGDFSGGFEFALAGLLQSPNLIYRTEYGEPDDERPGLRKLTGLELATKLSYLIWGSSPSDAMITMASQGELATSHQLRAEGKAMLEAPRARQTFDNFWNEYFELQGLDGLIKDQATYPEFSAAATRSMREETLRLMEHLVFEIGADMREMFTTRTTFVDGRLSAIYGLDAEGETRQRSFEKIELPVDARRAGVLGHASFLSVQSHIVTNSPTHRGKFILEALMCQGVEPAPPNVPTLIPEANPELDPQTLRERLENYFDQPGCGHCHAQIDYLGFGLENYDAIGRWRELDNGLAINARGTLNGMEFEDSATLGAAIAADPKSMNCMVRKTYRHVVGRIEQAGDEPLIAELTTKFVASNYRFEEMLLDIISSEAFLYVQEAQ
ncbi:MAG: DUF1592 domain-containing protein [Bradymonadaceae bacterium]|nr:DUF1592 domain-containing protein [Lujinxingiaceae bacterium]